jgi:phosphate:Na+ symporter
VIAALIALALFPLTIPWIVRASNAFDGVTLLAAYHTAFNVVGVLVLMPVIGWFTRFVERLLPDRTSPLTRALDPAALATPIAAAEAVRRSVARAVGSICGPLAAALAAAPGGGAAPAGTSAASVTEAAEALDKALEFMSDVSGPPEDEDEQRRVNSVLHALDHATRLAETAGGEAALAPAKGGPEDARAAELCAEAMQCASIVAGEAAAEPADICRARPQEKESSETAAKPAPPAALVRLEEAAKELGALRLAHRRATLGKVATGELTADEAIARVDAVARFEALARHAWRSAAYLAGHGE